MILTDSFLEAVSSETLILDCPRMELVPVTDGRPHYRGSGYIALHHGFLEFKLFSDAPESPSLLVTTQPSADRYQLKATDISHRTWQSSHTSPTFTNGAGIVASGKIAEIEFETQGVPEIQQDSVTLLWFPQELRLPYSQDTHSVTKTDEKLVSASWATNAATFSSSGFNFTIKADKRGTTIAASKQGDRPDALAARIQETLEFILGQSLQATIVQKVNATEITATITPSRLNATSGGAFPPLLSPSPDATWRLFDCFFRYVKDYTGTQRSPLSSILQYIYRLRTAPLEAQALALGVAVEGLLKNEYNGVAIPPDSFLAELQTAQDKLKDLDLSSTIENRMRGALKAMRESRAKDRLLELSRSGVILHKQVNIWSKLRNSAAHAEVHDDADKLSALCRGTLVLLHCLIFNVIGYVGPFTDYEKRSHPEREYPVAAESPVSSLEG